jgi:hypothetical protein
MIVQQLQDLTSLSSSGVRSSLAACVVALLDRFAQHCHKVDIDADSWRDQHAFERDDSPDTTTPPRRAKRR